ncbi:hypothetical protein BJF78_10545 [Pseudonocardia sp. CNS-139]|nr:hypothetical protein BJF78_10545 [Pseudonocardia sp. CNS-139]
MRGQVGRAAVDDDPGAHLLRHVGRGGVQEQGVLRAQPAAGGGPVRRRERAERGDVRGQVGGGEPVAQPPGDGRPVRGVGERPPGARVGERGAAG